MVSLIEPTRCHTQEAANPLPVHTCVPSSTEVCVLVRTKVPDGVTVLITASVSTKEWYENGGPHGSVVVVTVGMQGAGSALQPLVSTSTTEPSAPMLTPWPPLPLCTSSLSASAPHSPAGVPAPPWPGGPASA